MPYNLLVGLEITDAVLYQTYREQMQPLLSRYGGAFGVDVEVSRVLRAPEDARFNRLFTLIFPSRAVADAFFADDHYLRVKEQYFVGAVGAQHILPAWKF